MEFLDVVDDNDNVVKKAPFDEVYKKKLPHRIIHILIFNSKGEMALQLRSAKKSFAPLHWSTAVGGHVQSGETYQQAALREFQEELGTTAELEFAFNDFYENESGLKKFIATFKADYEGPFKINAEEVEKIEFFSMEKISEMIKAGENFHPELAFLLENHFQG